MNNGCFSFLDVSALIDGDLEVVLAERYPGDPTVNYVPAYRFALKRAGNSHAIGEIELRVGNTRDLIKYGGHIAYGVNAPYRGNRYAARACKLLLPLARAHGLTEIWITCNPDNTASRRTCELAGAVLIEIVDLPERLDMYQEGERQKCRYRIAL